MKLLDVEAENDKVLNWKLPEIQLSENSQIVLFSLCFTTTNREAVESDFFFLPSLSSGQSNLSLNR